MIYKGKENLFDSVFVIIIGTAHIIYYYFCFVITNSLDLDLAPQFNLLIYVEIVSTICYYSLLIHLVLNFHFLILLEELLARFLSAQLLSRVYFHLILPY